MITRKIGHQGCSLHRCAPAAASFDAFVPLLEGGAATSLGRFAIVRVFFAAALQVPRRPSLVSESAPIQLAAPEI
jgi:hypothetical protein